VVVSASAGSDTTPRTRLDEATRRALIARYRDGHRAILAAVDGATEAELDARPADGGWTAREVVHHVADSELTSAIRLRRLVAEEQPAIDGYDEAEFARRLYYGRRPIAASLEAIRAARLTTAEILDCLSGPEWARRGSHSQHATYGVEEWLEIYAAHCHEHAEQIRRARAVGLG
jgi:hypothetical protein